LELHPEHTPPMSTQGIDGLLKVDLAAWNSIQSSEAH